MTDEVQNDIYRALGTLEASVTNLTHEVRQFNKTHGEQSTQLAARVTVLERWRVYQMAFAAGASTVITLLSGLVYKLMTP
jgi:hypothetical protein